ncbi:ice-binding family protein [Yoonia sp.]|uniref:ice-binding family protein n=1 Tax=Yoonia sp. TaxID=2212373 RepID=UPI00391C3B5E
MSKLFRRLMGSTVIALPLGLAYANLGNAQSLQDFAIVSGEAITSTGPTTVTGDIAISPGSAFTITGSFVQHGNRYIGDAVALRIKNELTTLYTALASRQTSTNGDLTAIGELDNMVLKAGVYEFNGSANLKDGGLLTFDGENNPNAVFIINIESALTVGIGAEVALLNEAQAGNIFYRVGSSATLQSYSQMQGQIVAMESITFVTGAEIVCGAGFARSGAVTLDSNTIHICSLDSTDFEESGSSPLLTQNGRRVAQSLADIHSSGGTLPITFTILTAIQSPEELATSLDQLSGEVSTGIAPMGTQSMNAFLDVVIGSWQRPIAVPAPARDEGVPYGMVSDKINAPYGNKLVHGDSDVVVATGPATTSLAPSPELATQSSVYASLYGSSNETDGDSSQGWHDRTSQNRGIATGLNYALSDRTDLGVALSWNTAEFTLGDNAGSGSSETVFVALRGRTASERAYLEGALAFGRSAVTTDRTVTVAGTDRLVAETDADILAVHVEAGYSLGNFSPFVGLRAQSHTTKAFTETAAEGSSAYALRYDEQTSRSLRSELGVQMQWPLGDVPAASPTLGLRAAWAHEFATNDASTRTFADLPDASFTASGTTQDRNSLILGANVGFAATNGLFVEGGLNSEHSSNARNVGGSITVGYTW